MTIRSLAEVGIRLEKTAAVLSDDADSPQDHYDRLEQLAIQILDSEFDDYPEGALENFLRGFLSTKWHQLNLD